VKRGSGVQEGASGDAGVTAEGKSRSLQPNAVALPAARQIAKRLLSKQGKALLSAGKAMLCLQEKNPEFALSRIAAGKPPCDLKRLVAAAELPVTSM
jgi:hypothetical protein